MAKLFTTIGVLEIIVWKPYYAQKYERRNVQLVLHFLNVYSGLEFGISKMYQGLRYHFESDGARTQGIRHKVVKKTTWPSRPSWPAVPFIVHHEAILRILGPVK